MKQPDTAPPVPSWGGHWEWELDPWHKDAFPDDLKDFAPQQGIRSHVWILYDVWGNAIGIQRLKDD